MSNKNLATVSTDMIECYGNTAKNIIQAYRAGNQRVVHFVDQRWENALQKSAHQLRAEVRRNALAAQRAVSGIYIKGVTITSDRADIVVDKAVELAGKGVQQLAHNADAFEKRTGMATLSNLAKATLPAATLASNLAGKLEQGSSSLANAVAGGSARASVAAVKRSVERTVAKAGTRRSNTRKAVAPKAAKPATRKPRAKVQAESAESAQA